MKHIYVVYYCPNCEERYIVYASLLRSECNNFIKHYQKKYYSGWSDLSVFCLPLYKRILF